jgi:hypothetical protein
VITKLPAAPPPVYIGPIYINLEPDAIFFFTKPPSNYYIITTLRSCDVFRKSSRLWDNVERHGISGQATDNNMTRAPCMLITKATDKQYLIVHGNNGFLNAPQCYGYVHWLRCTRLNISLVLLVTALAPLRLLVFRNEEADWEQQHVSYSNLQVFNQPEDGNRCSFRNTSCSEHYKDKSSKTEYS